jgi:hypothetical protein
MRLSQKQITQQPYRIIVRVNNGKRLFLLDHNGRFFAFLDKYEEESL